VISYIMAGTASTEMTCLVRSDVVYAPFPLYHTVGVLLGTGQALLGGATVVLRTTFSASAFWNDCRRYNVTV
jgi:acyl-CoA synthetase (AMP-forming)/AMP-acid ligase II